MKKVFGLINYGKDKIIVFITYQFDLFTLLITTTQMLFSRSTREVERVIRRVMVNQIAFTGIDALPTLSIVASALGIITIVQLVTTLTKVGASTLVGKILVTVVIRELSPILTALLVVSRSGSAIAAELGNMKVSQEIDALEVMGINPIHFIVMPRFIGLSVSVFALTVYFNVIAILSGFIITGILFAVPFTVFIDNVISAMTFKDVIVCLIKSVIFGVTISLICCYHGFSVDRSPTQVPQQTSRAIVNSIVLCIVVSGLVTVLSYI